MRTVMKLRHALLLFVVLAVVACGGAVEEPVADEAASGPAAEVPMDDAAALDEMTEYYVTHYNLGHADMVAELYSQDAVFLSADGSVQEGRAAIQAALETAMESSPTVALEVADRVITGDWAVSHGVWNLEMTLEGAPGPLALEGHFMTVAQKVDGEWKTAGVVTNYYADPPEGTPVGEPPSEAPPDLTDSVLAELADYYATHYSMGHGDMVASRYAEDGMAAFANLPVARGRAAIAERLSERIGAGDDPQLAIHEVGAQDIGEGWVLGGGWYEIASSAGDMMGNYMMLCREGADGNMQIHWAVSNGHPVAE